MVVRDVTMNGMKPSLVLTTKMKTVKMLTMTTMIIYEKASLMTERLMAC